MDAMREMVARVPKTIIKRPVCPRHVMFLSLLIINTWLAARWTRTRVIGGYDSTREGA
jgi:hypothetical protein